MDLSSKWRAIFSERARRFKTPHDISHWSKEGFKVRLNAITKELKTIALPDDKVLDLGSGPGFYASLFKQPVLFDYATSVFGRTPAAAKAHKVVGAFQSIPFKDESFDGLLCVGVLQCMDLQNSDIEGASRVLKKGGWFLFETLNAESLELQGDLGPKESARLRSFLQSDTNLSEDHLTYTDFALYQAERLALRFERAGLTVTGVRWLYPSGILPTLRAGLFLNASHMRYKARCFYLLGRKT